MKILIIEDENLAAKHLASMVMQLEPSATIVRTIPSVSEGVDFLTHHQHEVDLILSDIQLNDGLSFEIFKATNCLKAIIFITAYDEYALQAFKVNGFDYLLKPIKKEELKAALDKYKSIFGAAQQLPNLELLLKTLQPEQPSFRNRFAVRYGDKLKTIPIEEVACFYTENKAVHLVTFEGRKYLIDGNLEELEKELDPKKWFRVNRQFIIGINGISEMFTYSKSRVLIKVKQLPNEEIIVSTERSGDFKAWLNQ
jgi:two-component system, LytTR family, response regulator LytT